MTKVLRCSEMVPGCDYVARAESEDELMQKAAQRAREKHGIETVSPELGQMIKSKIRDELSHALLTEAAQPTLP